MTTYEVNILYMFIHVCLYHSSTKLLVIILCYLIFKKGHLIKLMFTFNHSSFRHFVQEVNEILYLGSLIIGLPGYQVIKDKH